MKRKGKNKRKKLFSLKLFRTRPAKLNIVKFNEFNELIIILSLNASRHETSELLDTRFHLTNKIIMYGSLKSFSK